MFDWPVIIVAGTVFVAYANGAKDNFKGVATLFGSGTTLQGKSSVPTRFTRTVAALLSAGAFAVFASTGILARFR